MTSRQRTADDIYSPPPSHPGNWWVNKPNFFFFVTIETLWRKCFFSSQFFFCIFYQFWFDGILKNVFRRRDIRISTSTRLRQTKASHRSSFSQFLVLKKLNQCWALAVFSILNQWEMAFFAFSYQMILTGGRAGHFRYFLIFSLIKNDFLHFLSS